MEIFQTNKRVGVNSKSSYLTSHQKDYELGQIRCISRTANYDETNFRSVQWSFFLGSVKAFLTTKSFEKYA